MRRPTALLALFAAIALVDSRAASAGPPEESIFPDGFESGHTGAWSSDVGNVCPAFPDPFDLEGAIFVADDGFGGRLIVYEGAFGQVGDVVAAIGRIELYESYGGPTAPDTIDLGAGAEANYASCGTCVLLYQNADFVQSTVEKVYFQRNGTLEITTLEPAVDGTFSGILNGTLEEVTIDSETFTSTPVPGGCRIPIEGFSFSQTLDLPPT